MRKEFARAMVGLHKDHPEYIFLTGDLGYMALEKVRDIYQKKFINVGVAEQNMVSFAAGLAYEGFVPWVYSIAPFAILRPYEQIRNDVCLHNLPVKIVGNGGGYGYGIMGATHHTLEDIAVMRVLPNMKVYVPFIASDVEEAVRMMADDPSPNYLRLNLAAKLNHTIESFQQWRKVKDGKRVIIIGTGPVIGNILDIPDQSIIDDCEIWCVGIFPIHELPLELVSSLAGKRMVLTIEEHYGQCGLNETISRLLLSTISHPVMFKSLHAKGYPSGKVGSQKWHQEENDLAGESLRRIIKEYVHN